MINVRSRTVCIEYCFWMGKRRDDLMAKNRAYAKLIIDTNSRQLPLKGFIRKGKEFYITSKGKEYEFIETFVSIECVSE